MAYLIAGLVDSGMPDYAVETAMVKAVGKELLRYAANRAFQLAGGKAYVLGEPDEKILRDLRVFPIVEGANDLTRVFVALSGLELIGEE